MRTRWKKKKKGVHQVPLAASIGYERYLEKTHTARKEHANLTLTLQLGFKQ